mmetsp:Transcript_12058/g.13261  ORF Transcript_12058/g.13261 Transcript_12058/m.13261 type:complete len:212 (+) Transcript_12058:69-704(+)
MALVQPMIHCNTVQIQNHSNHHLVRKILVINLIVMNTTKKKTPKGRILLTRITIVWRVATKKMTMMIWRLPRQQWQGYECRRKRKVTTMNKTMMVSIVHLEWHLYHSPPIHKLVKNVPSVRNADSIPPSLYKPCDRSMAKHPNRRICMEEPNMENNVRPHDDWPNDKPSKLNTKKMLWCVLLPAVKTKRKPRDYYEKRQVTCQLLRILETW